LMSIAMRKGAGFAICSGRPPERLDRPGLTLRSQPGVLSQM